MRSLKITFFWTSSPARFHLERHSGKIWRQEKRGSDCASGSTYGIHYWTLEKRRARRVSCGGGTSGSGSKSHAYDSGAYNYVSSKHWPVRAGSKAGAAFGSLSSTFFSSFVSPQSRVSRASRSQRCTTLSFVPLLRLTFMHQIPCINPLLKMPSDWMIQMPISIYYYKDQMR